MLFSKNEHIEYLTKEELCYPSLTILQDRISDFFNEKRGEQTTAFPIHACDNIWPQSEIIDIILFGDALHALIGGNLWPRQQTFKIWTLCRDMASLLSTVTGISIEYFGIIDRYGIFPKSEKESQFTIKPNKPIKFLMSSSFAISKNIELTVRVVNFFQQKLNTDVSLDICSAKPETYIVKEVIESLKWKKKPTIHGDLGVNWVDHFDSHYVFINFSTNLFEDFGVSIAQAQSVGMPLIVSQWGAHKDIFGNNIIKVPLEITGLHLQDEEQIKKSAIKTFEYIKKCSSTKHPAYNIEKEPVKINITQVLEIQEKLEKNKETILELYRGSIFPKDNPIAKRIIQHFC